MGRFKLFRKQLALFLSLLMVLSAVTPFNVSAKDETSTDYNENYTADADININDNSNAEQIPAEEELLPLQFGENVVTTSPPSVGVGSAQIGDVTVNDVNLMREVQLPDYTSGTVTLYVNEEIRFSPFTIHNPQSLESGLIRVEVSNGIITFTGVRPPAALSDGRTQSPAFQTTPQTAFNVRAEYGENTATFNLNVNITRIPFTITPATVTLNNDNAGQEQFVELNGLADNLTVDSMPQISGNIPDHIEVFFCIDRRQIIVKGERPPAGTSVGQVPVDVQYGDTRRLTVNAGGLTALPAQNAPACGCGAIQVSINASNGLITAHNFPETAIKTCDGGALRLNIPAQISGVTVTGIGQTAFRLTRIEEITLPPGVVSIGNRAFAESQLRVINLNQGLQTIGAGAFYQTQLTSIVIPNTVERIMSGNGTATVIGTSAQTPNLRTFGDNPLLSSVTLSNNPNFTVIEAGAFYNTPSLNQIVIPSNIKIIGERAFRVPGDVAQQDRGIKTLTLNEGLEEIHKGAFFGAPIEVLRIPNSVRRIASGTDAGAATVGTTLTLESQPPNPGQLANRWHRTFGHNPFLKEVYIGTQLNMDGTASGISQLDIIEPGTFFGATGLEKLHLGNPIEIRTHAFHGMPAPLPHNITANYDLSDGRGFENSNVNRNAFNFRAISACERLLWEVGNGGATIVSYLRFVHVPPPADIRTLRIPMRVTDIPHYEQGELIGELDGGGTVQLNDNSVLTTSRLNPMGLRITIIGVEALRHQPMQGVQWHNQMREIYLPPSIRIIEDRAFMDAPLLERIHLNEGLEEIGKGAFFSAESLRIIKIPDSVTRIRSGYTNPAPPATHPTNHCRVHPRTALSLQLHDDSCEDCLTIRTRVHGSNTLQQNYAWHRTGVQLLRHGDSRGAQAPPTTRHGTDAAQCMLGSYAFGYNHSLETIIIGKGLEVIEPGTFHDARSLTNIHLGNVKVIGTSAFEFISGRTSDSLNIVWSEDLEVIGPRAFFNATHTFNNVENITVCDKLREVSVTTRVHNPETSPTEGIDLRKTNLMAIGRRAFSGANGLESLYLNDDLRFIHRGAFANAAKLMGHPRLTTCYTSCPDDWHLCIPDSVEIIFSGDGFSDAQASQLGTAPDWTFANAEALKGIRIGYSVSTIDPGSFSNAPILNYLYLGGVGIVGARAFENAYELDYIKFGPSLTHIHERAFINSRISCAGGCAHTDCGIVFESAFRVIGDFAFANADGLVRLELNPGLVEIGRGAFANAGSLRGQRRKSSCHTRCPDDWHLCIPNSVATIRSDNSAGGTNQRTSPTGRTFGRVCRWVERDPNTNDERRCVATAALSAVIFGEDSLLTDIEPGAFACNPNMDTLHMGNRIGVIGTSAFEHSCRLGGNIIWSNSLHTIENRAFLFKGTTSTGPEYTITFPNSLMTIGNHAFYNASRVREVIFPEGRNFTSIGRGAFFNALSLERIKIPDTVLTGSAAVAGFESTSTEERVTYDNTVFPPRPINIILCDWTFGNTVSLTNLVIGDGVIDIPASAFRLAGGSYFSPRPIGDGEDTVIPELAIKLGNNTQTVGDHAFRGRTNLCDLSSDTLNNVIREIGEGAFMNAGSKNITLPSTVQTIGINAFADAENLERLVLNDGLLNIEQGAFRNAVRLGIRHNENDQPWTLVFPSSLQTLHSAVGVNNRTFGGAVSLEQIEFKYEPVPDGVRGLTVIRTETFRGATALKSLNLGSVTEIGVAAFMDAPIENLKMDSVTVIGADAFRNNTGLKTLILPPSVRTIGNHAFSGATSLNTLELNDDLTSIGTGAFSGATSLAGELRIPNSVTSISSGTGNNDRTFGGPLVGGQPANQLDSVIIGNGITTVAQGMLSGSGVSYISVGTNVERIENQAFAVAPGYLETIVFMGDAPTVPAPATTFPTPTNRHENFTTYHLWGNLGWDLLDEEGRWSSAWPLAQRLPAVELDGNVPVRIRLDAPASLVPGQTVNLNNYLEIFDTQGELMSGVNVTWTLDRGVTGDSTELSENGVLTVSDDSVVGVVWVRVTTQTQHPISRRIRISLEGAPFAIRLQPEDSHSFTNINPLTLTVYNRGTQDTGPLTVALSGANPQSFEVSRPVIENIPVNQFVTLTVTPRADIVAMSHSAVLSVTGGNPSRSRSIILNYSLGLPVVIFDLNGGTHTGGGELNQQVELGGAATLPTVRRDSHRLTGWVSNPPGIQPNNITANVTFTAQWQAISGGCNCVFANHVLGDINGDGFVDFGDMTAMRLFIAGEQAFPPTAAQWQFAAVGRHGRIGQSLKTLNTGVTCDCGFGDHILGDINGDGEADFGDMTAMRLFIAGEQAFPPTVAQWQFAAAGRYGRIDRTLNDINS